MVACHRPPAPVRPPPGPTAGPTASLSPAQQAAGNKQGGYPDFAVDAVKTEEGKALWYDVPDDSLAARRAWPEEMTAASDRLPQDTYVRVTRLDPDKGTVPKPVIVRITDKSVGRRDALIEVDHDAARLLGMVKEGSARVRVDVLALKNASLDKPVDKKDGSSAPKTSTITDKPAASVEKEKEAAQQKSGDAKVP